MDNSELLKRLNAAFREEAREHIDTVIRGLIELEKDIADEEKQSKLETIYRSMHSLKGASRTVSLKEVERLCQALESCFSLIKKGAFNPTPPIFDLFHSCIGLIEKISFSEENSQPSISEINECIGLLGDIQNLNESRLSERLSRENKDGEEVEHKTVTSEAEKNDVNEVKKEETKEEEPAKEVGKAEISNIRISTKRFDEIFLLAEESLQIKLSHREEHNTIKQLAEEMLLLQKKWSPAYLEYVKISQDKKGVDKELDIFKDFDQIDESIKLMNNRLRSLMRTSDYVTNATQNTLERLVDEIRETMMVPFSNLLDSIPRTVRDLSKNTGKEVELEVKDANIEVDKKIIEGISDPMIHLIRNSIDHGIEAPAMREAAGKNRKGSLLVSIDHYDANSIKIEIEDDGAGIDRKQILKNALEKKLISEADRKTLSDEEVLGLIFKSGVSSAEIITNLSGRGLGLAIVQENIEKLGGKVRVSSTTGKGTKFNIVVPSRISKMHGLIIVAGGKRMIIPDLNVKEALRVNKDQVKKVENRWTIQHQNSILPLFSLADVLQLKSIKPSGDYLYLVIVELLNTTIGFVVDKVEVEQEVLLKRFHFPVIKVRNFSGVCILGTGELCPVINSRELVVSAMDIKETGTEFDIEEGGEREKTKSVLLAEDSITSRMFLKNILENAGYRVKVTVDGKEALTSLKQEPFDLVVSDVEMPRMSGFKLTENIRSDKKLSAIPVILVTSLNNREHQERGIEVGANAYITKSSFEESNLLEVVKRLI